MLLDRGLGAAGVAIDSAPPRGVLVTQLSALRSNAPVLFQWGAWRNVVHPSFEGFQYAWVHTLPEPEQRAAYERYVTPETGRIFFEAALGRKSVAVDFANSSRPSLLLIGGELDHIVPATVNRSNFKRPQASSALTEFKVFPDRTHWIIAQPGWEEVAAYIDRWLRGLNGRPVASRAS